ncbi:hypothetical protein FLM48_01065 [Shewanella sp. Scap07]|uniref:hypothetical protein n=1 Tax=Shewanella sp. Scap07 TaxID=2589987 RepID=UPI0015BFC345|nr:hypothetical protein [Shewanella sp. Scap07]QLE83802.1 hypothetical protein FLM48_01065 [Shewanella sp. Scap07]
MINDLGNGITTGAVALCYLVRYSQRTGKVLLAAVLSLVMVPLLKHYFDAPRPAAAALTGNLIEAGSRYAI